MKIIALPDLHGSQFGVKVVEGIDRLGARLAAVDLVLLAGDLGGKLREAQAVLDAVRRHNAHVLAVPGNWDTREVQAALEAEGINLHRRHVVMNSLAFLGAGGSLSPGIPMPCLFTETQFADILAAAAAGVDPALPKVLVCHQPPVDTIADRLWNGKHVGSKSVRAFIERVQPLVCFTGHIHEGQGIDRIGATPIVNPGMLAEGRYAYAEIGTGIEVLEIREL